MHFRGPVESKRCRAVNQFEAEFEARLQTLDSDSRACATFAYTELTLHFHFGSNFEIRDRVNKQAGFWNGLLGALQASAFVALGRMYDADNKRYTIQSLLKFASEHRGLFGRDELRRRKQVAGLAPKVAAVYVADAYVPTGADLQKLSSATKALQSEYRESVEPIRHQVFAHAGKLSAEERGELFTKVMVRTLERLVVFPLQLHRALWGLYHNGQKPDLQEAPTVIVDVLRAIPPDGTSTWEHLHAAKNAVEFAGWLRTAPVPRDKDMETIAAQIAALIERERVGPAGGGES